MPRLPGDQGRGPISITLNLSDEMSGNQVDGLPPALLSYLKLPGSETWTSQDASIWLESESGGRPAGSGCATADGIETARRLTSSRRKATTVGSITADSRQPLHDEQSILIDLFVCSWLTGRFFALGNIFFRLRLPHDPREANQPKIDTLYSTPPTRELKTELRSQFPDISF